MVVGGLTAAAVALGGNLGGVTSGLLALDGGELAGRLRLDVLVPVRGLKRCYDAANGFGARPAGSAGRSWLRGRGGAPAAAGRPARGAGRGGAPAERSTWGLGDRGALARALR